MYTEAEILAQLDACAGAFVFPMLDNGYVYPVDARLRAFRDDTRWALTIEVVGYPPRSSGLEIAIHPFGNCLKGAPGLGNDDFVSLIPLDEIELRDDPERAIAGLTSVLLRGRRIALVAHDDPWPLEALFRSLTPAHRELLLATDDEVRARVPRDLPQLLQLEEWCHPDVCGEERPSESPTFQSIASAIVSGDPSRYVPSAPPNTHWSNWPGGGAL